MRTLYKFLLTVLCLAVFTSHSVLASAQTNTLNVLLQHIARNSDNVPLYILRQVTIPIRVAYEGTQV